ncbi:hypothetical protein [Companilactobacillus bobalius]|uniref:Uncharacterized protein n=1 Tax=Companilactobacillus bobalius DSM 19674 TaxID=1423788 RepID=A0A0R1KV50_9LACO|nr:hypothetical protein [Companilactobacillus bobalius]KRK83047.1 hypothetical protein FC78_GL001855 [Companilactobacillus bobalius DSM 19674]
MKLPLSFAGLFVGSNDDETKQNFESVKTKLDNAMQKMLRIAYGYNILTMTLLRPIVF